MSECTRVVDESGANARPIALFGATRQALATPSPVGSDGEGTINLCDPRQAWQDVQRILPGTQPRGG